LKPRSRGWRARLLASTALAGAILLAALATGAQAQMVINITVASDTGTSSSGATAANTLSAALAQINASTPPGRAAWRTIGEVADV
jgi:hypothetical protein